MHVVLRARGLVYQHLEHVVEQTLFHCCFPTLARQLGKFFAKIFTSVSIFFMHSSFLLRKKYNFLVSLDHLKL